MILTCAECQTEYRLAPALLGTHGCTVRCTSCKHTWFQQHVPEQNIENVIAENVPEGEKEETSLMDDLVEENDDSILPDMGEIPNSVKPLSTNVVGEKTVYFLMGMGAVQYGVFTFLSCIFTSLSLLFLLKAPVMSYLPETALFYQSIGIDVPSPGEGLRFSEMTAEQHIDQSDRTLKVHAKLTNITEEKISYPALRVLLKSPYGVVMQEWQVESKHTDVLASEEVTLVELEFKEIPEGASDVEIRVARP